MIAANQILWHSRSNAVILTIYYPIAISGAVQHYGRIGSNRNRIVKNGRISGQPEPDSWYIPNCFWYTAQWMWNIHILLVISVHLISLCCISVALLRVHFSIWYTRKNICCLLDVLDNNSPH